VNSSFLKIASDIAGVDLQAARKSRSKKKVSKKKVSKPSKGRKPSRTSQPVRQTQDIQYEDMTIPQTEYSARMELSLSVDFEGAADKAALMTKLKQEIVDSIESGVSITARSFNLRASNLKVKPLKVNMDVNDVTSLDEDFSM
jgi:hypothetical protein